MRALTLTAPWSGAVAAGGKRIENRPRALIHSRDFGKPFAIHASRQVSWSVYERIAAIDPTMRAYPAELDTTLAAAPALSGWCEACARPVPLTPDGVMRSHRAYPNDRRSTARCRGSGALPLEIMRLVPCAADAVGAREIYGSTYRPERVAPLWLPEATPLWFKLSRVRSAVIAIATVERAVMVPFSIREGTPEYAAALEEIRETLPPYQRRWFFGRVGYVLRDEVALAEPVPCGGAQGFWTLPEDVETQVLRRALEIALDDQRREIERQLGAAP